MASINILGLDDLNEPTKSTDTKPKRPAQRRKTATVKAKGKGKVINEETNLLPEIKPKSTTPGNASDKPVSLGLKELMAEMAAEKAKSKAKTLSNTQKTKSTTPKPKKEEPLLTDEVVEEFLKNHERNNGPLKSPAVRQTSNRKDLATPKNVAPATVRTNKQCPKPTSRGAKSDSLITLEDLALSAFSSAALSSLPSKITMARRDTSRYRESLEKRARRFFEGLITRCWQDEAWRLSEPLETAINEIEGALRFRAQFCDNQSKTLQALLAVRGDYEQLIRLWLNDQTRAQSQPIPPPPAEINQFLADFSRELSDIDNRIQNLVTNYDNAIGELRYYVHRHCVAFWEPSRSVLPRRFKEINVSKSRPARKRIAAPAYANRVERFYCEVFQPKVKRLWQMFIAWMKQ